MSQALPPSPSVPPAPIDNAARGLLDGGSTQTVGQTVDEGRGRIFPCEQCGADLVFHIGQQSLKCPYCSHEKSLEFAPDAEVAEQDFEALLARLESRTAADGAAEVQDVQEVRCDSCGGNVVFTGTLTSTSCPWCGCPIQREDVHDAEDRVPVDGILPFLVSRDKANANLRRWVQSRWFAPNDFCQQGVGGKFNGVYLPYYTFDTLTANRYSGMRGDHYYVTVGSGKDRRRVRRTRWTSTAGHFQRFFDDVLTLAAHALPRWLTLELEPWPLHKCVPFNQQVLAGFLARTYDIPLKDGFQDARQRIDEAIAAEVRQRIGGDEQRIESLNTQHQAITCKHLLLPVWLLTYRYQEHAYLVAVNAGTGEVQGERPYSWIKITMAVIAGLIAAGTLFAVFQAAQ